MNQQKSKSVPQLCGGEPVVAKLCGGVGLNVVSTWREILRKFAGYFKWLAQLSALSHRRKNHYADFTQLCGIRRGLNVVST